MRSTSALLPDVSQVGPAIIAIPDWGSLPVPNMVAMLRIGPGIRIHTLRTGA